MTWEGSQQGGCEMDLVIACMYVPRIVACSFDSLVGRSRILIVVSYSSDMFEIKSRTREG
jgi:hypothetical protein